MSSPRPRRLRVLIFLLSWLIVLVAIFANQQRIIDWWKLRGYTPDSSVVALSTKNTMTPYAQHLLYVNKPQISNGQDFSSKCPKASEKTVILGCYLGGDNGIFLFSVADSRLEGVVEVTAAHEMLHAAYERLSRAERSRIDKLLTDFNQNNLSDERIKQTIAAYRKSEPNDLPNEMHSIFATEVRTLPSELEIYYQRYFTNRKAIATLTETYQSEFTNRRAQVEAYDRQLTVLKRSIENIQSELAGKRSAIQADQSEMQALREMDSTAAYNAMVPTYNSLINTYNSLIESLRSQIATYNDIVEKRNALALEERQLAQALSADAIPSQK